MNIKQNTLNQVLQELSTYLEERMIPFWVANGIDSEFGGFHTAFDGDGKRDTNTDRLIISQTRMLWAFSHFSQRYPFHKEYAAIAQQGFAFIKEHFWDTEYGGWYWLVSRKGQVLDGEKVLYGQGFAMYALSQYYLASGDKEALEYAEKTFELLQVYAADSLYGGYYENFNRDWSLCEAGSAGGDRKCFDNHLHLMEALTVLYQASGKTIHRRKLEELIMLIIQKMINRKEMCVFNQFNPSFEPIPAILVKKTWRMVREKATLSQTPSDTTSYGYNVEFSWLLNRAGSVLGYPVDYFKDITRKLTDYMLNYGFDHQFGGVYRDGTHSGIILRYEKDFWQTCEALIGLLDMYQLTLDSKYIEAYLLNYHFAMNHFVNPKTGEWHQLVSREGEAIIPELNIWRSAFHTGRAVMESIDRLMAIIERDEIKE